MELEGLWNNSPLLHLVMQNKTLLSREKAELSGAWGRAGRHLKHDVHSDESWFQLVFGKVVESVYLSVVAVVLDMMYDIT